MEVQFDCLAPTSRTANLSEEDLVAYDEAIIDKIDILHLSYRARALGGGQLSNEGFSAFPKVPYMLVNCVFRPQPGYYHDKAMAFAQEYKQVVITGSPEEEDARFKDRFENHFVDFGTDDDSTFSKDFSKWANSLPPVEQTWTHSEPIWYYQPKFDIFQMKEWCSDCAVTRACLSELSHYQESGKMLSIYRSTDEEIVLKHLQTINSYWD